MDTFVFHPTLQVSDCVIHLSEADVDFIQPIDECIFPEILRQRFVEVGLKSLDTLLKVGQLSHPERIWLGLSSLECLLDLGECLVEQLRIVVEDWWSI